MTGIPDAHDRPTASGRVVVGVSASPAGLQALRFGVIEARWRHTTLCAVRAFCFNPPWHGPEVQQFRIEFATEGRRYVRHAFGTAMAGMPHDVEVQIETPNARVEQGLMAAASGCDDVLVIGGHAHRGRPSKLIGYCLRHARCPVVVVPAPDLVRDWGRRAVRGLLDEIAGSLRSLDA